MLPPLPDERNAPPGRRLRNGRGRQVISGGPLLLGECGAVSWRLCSAGSRPRQPRQLGGSCSPTLRDRLKLPAGDGEALAARLLMPLTLVHIENADTFEAGQIAGDLAASLPGCALVVSARLRGLGADAGWREVVVAPFDAATALEQLRAELGAEGAGPGKLARPRCRPGLPPVGIAPGSRALACGPLGRRPFSGACERKIWPSRVPIRQIRPSGRAAACCFPIPSSLSLDALRPRGRSRRRAMARGLLGTWSRAGHGVWREPRRCYIGPHRRDIRGHGFCRIPPVLARSGAAWSGHRLPSPSAPGRTHPSPRRHRRGPYPDDRLVCCAPAGGGRGSGKTVA